jgi:hypothetical protein
MAASKVTEICEEFPEIHTHCPQMNRASSWFSYLTAGNVALGRVGILLVHIPKGRPNPKVNRAGRWPPYPPVGCPPDCQLWQRCNSTGRDRRSCWKSDTIASFRISRRWKHQHRDQWLRKRNILIIEQLIEQCTLGKDLGRANLLKLGPGIETNNVCITVFVTA